MLLRVSSHYPGIWALLLLVALVGWGHAAAAQESTMGVTLTPREPISDAPIPPARQALPASSSAPTGTSSDVPSHGAASSIEHLQRGQKGYGLSVFSGTEPESFDVEVLGVWRNSKPEFSYLLARLSGQDLERSGVLGGMSGSPVYFDGELVGAVAFSFSFGLDPIAGITPIDAMREIPSADAPGFVRPLELEPNLPIETQAAGSAGVLPGKVEPVLKSGPRPTTISALGAAPTLMELAQGDLPPDLLERYLDLLAPKSLGVEGRSAMTWTASGFGGQAQTMLATRLGDLLPSFSSKMAGSGGSFSPSSSKASPSQDSSSQDSPARDITLGESDQPADHQPPAVADLQPGDAVALVLVRGDMSLASHGTVTDRMGESILAFGHPIYALGPVSLPMAASEVITPVPSVSSSFKLSNAGPILGVFDQDREAGAHGVLGVEPALTPVTIRLSGIEEREFDMELADSPIFRPTLLAVTTMGAINTGSYATGFQGLDLAARFDIEGHEPVFIRRSFDGNQAVTNAAIHLLGVAVFLEMNDLGTAPITGVEINIHQEHEPRAVTLLGARAEKLEVAPGEKVGVQLELQPYRGEIYRREVEVTIPPDLSDGLFYLMLGDGSSIDAVRLTVEKRETRTLEQGLEMLRSFHSNRELHLLGLVGAPGRTIEGEPLPDLPAGVRAMLGDGGTPLELRITGVEKMDFGIPLDGVARLDFRVRRPLD